MVAAAVVGSAVVGAGASIASSSAASKAQQSAANSANQVTLAQLAQQQKQYDQDRADLAPYRSVGTGALYTLGNLLGIQPANDTSGSGGGADWNAYLQANPDVMAGFNNLSAADRQRFATPADYAQFHYQTYGQAEGRSLPTAQGAYAAGTPNADTGLLNKKFTMDDFEADPGYQFRIDQGNRGLEASASATGGVLSGGTLKALARYNQDAASQEYQNAYGRFQTDQNNRFNRLASIAGVGQTATNTGIAAGQSNQAAQAAGTSQIANNTLSAGNARASQYVATGNAIGGLAGNVGQYYALKDLYTPTTYGGTPPIYGGNLGGIY